MTCSSLAPFARRAATMRISCGRNCSRVSTPPPNAFCGYIHSTRSKGVKGCHKCAAAQHAGAAHMTIIIPVDKEVTMPRVSNVEQQNLIRLTVIFAAQKLWRSRPKSHLPDRRACESVPTFRYTQHRVKARGGPNASLELNSPPCNHPVSHSDALGLCCVAVAPGAALC